jgi:hypothetical protein
MSTIGSKREATELSKSTLFRKYAKTTRADIDPYKKLKPSEFKRSDHYFNLDEYPKIIELNNMADNTAQVHSTVDMVCLCMYMYAYVYIYICIYIDLYRNVELNYMYLQMRAEI